MNEPERAKPFDTWDEEAALECFNYLKGNIDGARPWELPLGGEIEAMAFIIRRHHFEDGCARELERVAADRPTHPAKWSAKIVRRFTPLERSQ
jgi:hypothetical protein